MIEQDPPVERFLNATQMTQTIELRATRINQMLN
jgi:hypothetical protein